MSAGLVVTTSRTERAEELRLGVRLAAELGCPLRRRHGRTVQGLIRDENLSGAVVCGPDQPVWHGADGSRFWFHPNMAVTRARSARRHRVADPLARAAELVPGDRVLDATCGLGADAMVCNEVVGPSGLVVALEASPVVAALVRRGVATYQHPLLPGMSRVTVITGDHREHLRPDGPLAAVGWDVICFDPMFAETVSTSQGLDGLRELACYDGLAPETITAAQALARRAVVVKHRGDDHRLDSLGPQQQVGGRRGRIGYTVFAGRLDEG